MPLLIEHRHLIGLVLMLGIACVACGPPDAGTRLADELRALNSPVVASVEYDGYNDGSGPVLDIVAKPGVPPKQAREFGCVFVVPAVAARAADLPEDFGWSIWSPTQEQLWSHEEMPCPND